MMSSSEVFCRYFSNFGREVFLCYNLNMPTKLYKILLILGIAAVIAATVLFWLYWQPAKNLEVDFLDVGQGDAELIKTPAGQNILIDGGPDSSIIRRLGENLAWWDKKIDLMILTHPHDDHVTGLIDVLKRYRVKQILYTGVVHNAPNYLSWLEQVRDRKIKMVIIDRPQTISLANNCRLQIIYPLNSFLDRTMNNLNNSSIVMKLVYGQSSFLFLGDTEKEVEQELITDKIDLAAEVLKVAHHGSDTSSSQDFLEAVKPEFSVIEVGKDNDFGHPSLRVIKRLERVGAKVMRTDTNGTIRIISDGRGVFLK